ncbi:MAG: ATP-binding protein [Desulfobacterales bacterium]
MNTAYMMRKTRKRPLYLPALSILAVVILLLVWITFSTYRNLNRDRKRTLTFVRQQGLTLLHTLESGIRAGLRSPGPHDEFVQRLIEEAGINRTIAYIYIFDENGRIVNHSLPLAEGAKSDWDSRLTAAGIAETRLKILPDGSRIYEFATIYTPGKFSTQGANAPVKRSKARQNLHGEWGLVLGMTLKTFTEARRSDLYHAAIMAAIVISLGAGALFFIYVIQTYYMVDRTLEETRDYTKQVEERARRSEKLAAVGKLASGVAHEIRNPLSSIRGFAQHLSLSLADRPLEKEYADIMVKEVDRINNVVSDLLTLSRPSAPEIDWVDIDGLVSHALRLIEDDAQARNIEIHKHIPPGTAPVPIDANQMTQVLLNLLLNALQAVDADGEISIGCHTDKPSGTVYLWVEDNGPGIPAELGEKIFDPFVTTREEGNGLGLTIVRTILENHLGDIHVASPPPGKTNGSRFTLAFPMKGVHPENREVT